jgi:hypothetical protein
VLVEERFDDLRRSVEEPLLELIERQEAVGVAVDLIQKILR